MNQTAYSFEDYCAMISEFSPSMDDYPYVMDMIENTYYISEKATGRFCFSQNYFTNADTAFEEFVHPDDLKMLSIDLQRMMSGKKQIHNITYRWLGKDKEPIWINCRGRVLCDAAGRLRFLIGCINEVGRKPIADNVSGMLESSALSDFLSACCLNSQAGFVLRIGIDEFKDINERLGMEYGDFVLHGVASCIEASLQPGQKAFRVPSDEYLVVDFANGTREEAIGLYRRIRTAVDKLIFDNNYEAVYTISGGILELAPMANSQYEDIMKLSQFALNEAKNRGRNQVYEFEEQDYDRFLRKREILLASRQAVEEDCKGFSMVYQPIVHAGTGRLYAAEALLRFEMADGEKVAPEEFVPVLEESGLIIPIGRWIMKQVVSMCCQVQKFIPDFKISMNLSYIQILKSSVADDICRQLAESGLRPDSLIVEMTESGYLENSLPVRKMWEHLKKFGISIAIDDFGTGYSNLQSIGNLAPNIVKLDRGFTVKALNNDYENRIMRYVIDMVHSIQLKICVEGIETELELAQLRGLGPDYIQGFYFGKPCTEAEFLEKYVESVQLLS